MNTENNINITNLQNDIITLENENAELRRKIALYEKSYDAVREVKDAVKTMSTYKGYTFFQNYFIGTDTMGEFSKIDRSIEGLLKRQVSLSKTVKEQIEIYRRYMTLFFMKEKLSFPSCKLALLLQISGADNAQGLIDKIFENKNSSMGAIAILSFYYKLLEELAGKAKSKNAVWDEFGLTVVKETPPKNDKERNKREIRDNTIRNFYRKHGEKMFLPENMSVLKSNLKKAGINIDEISDARIKHIVKRG